MHTNLKNIGSVVRAQRNAERKTEKRRRQQRHQQLKFSIVIRALGYPVIYLFRGEIVSIFEKLYLLWKFEGFMVFKIISLI